MIEITAMAIIAALIFIDLLIVIGLLWKAIFKSKKRKRRKG